MGSSLQDNNMSDYHIRLYKDADDEVVKKVYACGIMEHTRVAFDHSLTLPHIWLFILVVFLLPLLTTGSITLSILGGALALVGLWLGNRDILSYYVHSRLSNDMLDIHKYYLQRDDYCFWVAESAGEVVGMVAAVPASHSAGERHIELRRMSVAKSHRGKGIAKALCRTVIDFAREKGYSAVILDTTLAQIDAQRLYEKMGFRYICTYYVPKFTAKLIDFRLLFYQYDILTGR
ncbi:hypothetical protein FKM82_019214 [Ascaphus truei]